MEREGSNVVRIGSLELRFLVDETQESRSVVMFEFIVPPAAKVPAPHYHREVDEVVYGMGGTLTTTLDGYKHELRAGDALFVRRGLVHHHENLHSETARALVVLTPGLIGRHYFEEMAVEVSGPQKPDPTKIQNIMLRHGLVPA
jgi:quercetin dioxygenase-like cupin family protein